MQLTQNWVGYLDRSYEQVKASVLQRLGLNNPEISDHTESNILIIIVSMFSGIAEVLNLYIDAMAREAFIGTARKYTSIVKHAKLLNYNIKARIPATVNLRFTLVDDLTNLPVPFTPTTAFANMIIPKGIVVIADNGVQFVTQVEARIRPNFTNTQSTASQYVQITNQIIGTTNGVAGQKVLLPFNYVHSSSTLIINSVAWSEVTSLGLADFNDKVYVVSIEEDGNAYVVFGDGVNGEIPPNSVTIYANYKITDGVAGNVPPSFINTIDSVVPTPTGTHLEVINPDYASGGSDFESTNSIRSAAPKSLRTLERAVTYRDYIDLGELAPGVGKAALDYCCGKDVDLYIGPLSRGIATIALINDTRDYYEDKRTVTTKINVYAAGITRIYIKATLYGEPLFTPNEVFEAAVSALNDNYNYDNSDINRTIKISSIVTLLENLNEVDSLDIVQLYIEPYARPVNTQNTLTITFGEIKRSIPIKYRLVYQSLSNSFDVYRGGTYVGYAVIGQQFIDSSSPNEVSFNIGDGTYLNNNEWEFIAFPSFPENFPDYSIEITDNSIPIFDVITPATESSPSQIFGNLTVQINTSGQFQKPSCS